MRLRFARVVPMIRVDSYITGRGEMSGRLLGLVRVAHGEGEEFDIRELATFLNDAVLLAPSFLLTETVTWSQGDGDSFDVTLGNVGHAVTARVLVDERGAPPGLQHDGSLRQPARRNHPRRIPVQVGQLSVGRADTTAGSPGPTRHTPTLEPEIHQAGATAQPVGDLRRRVTPPIKATTCSSPTSARLAAGLGRRGTPAATGQLCTVCAATPTASPAPRSPAPHRHTGATKSQHPVSQPTQPPPATLPPPPSASPRGGGCGTPRSPPHPAVAARPQRRVGRSQSPCTDPPASVRAAMSELRVLRRSGGSPPWAYSAGHGAGASRSGDGAVRGGRHWAAG